MANFGKCYPTSVCLQKTWATRLLAMSCLGQVWGQQRRGIHLNCGRSARNDRSPGENSPLPWFGHDAMWGPRCVVVDGCCERDVKSKELIRSGNSTEHFPQEREREERRRHREARIKACFILIYWEGMQWTCLHTLHIQRVVNREEWQ